MSSTNSSPPKRARVSELTHRGAQPARDLHQQIIPRRVAEGIIDEP